MREWVRKASQPYAPTVPRLKANAMTLAMPVHNLPVVDTTPDSLITVSKLEAPSGHSHLIHPAMNVAIHIVPLSIDERGYDCE